MTAILIVICAAALLVAIWWINSERNNRLLERHSIEPEELQAQRASNPDMLVYDVRLPLDLLADSEIIPGAKRLAPKDVIENPSLIPKDKEAVIYCTCRSEKTSRNILKRALALNFTRIKFLRGGLEDWKAKGYPVEPYQKTFRLDSAT
jgi:rhodanese-related sulfurtransferase